MPAGGTTGQVLTKLSNADNATNWQTPAAGGGLTLPLTQDLTFSPDQAWNIGAPTASRPYQVYVGSTVWIGSGSNTMQIMPDTIGAPFALTIRAGGGYDLQLFPASPGRVLWSQNLVPGSNNLYDIGQANTRVRSLYLSTSLFLYNLYAGPADYERLTVNWSGNNAQVLTENAGSGVARNLLVGSAGAAAVSLVTANTQRWQVSAAGHLLAIADSTYDIGASGATRPRNLWIAGTGQFSGRVGIGQAPSTDEFLVVNGNVSVMNAAGFGGGYQGGVAITVQGSNYNHGLWSKASVRSGGNGWLIDQVRVDGIPTSGGFTGVDYRSFYIGAINVAAGFATNYALYVGNPSGAATNIGIYNEGATQLMGGLTVQGTLTLPSGSVTTPMLAMHSVAIVRGTYSASPTFTLNNGTTTMTPIAVTANFQGGVIQVDVYLPVEHTAANSIIYAWLWLDGASWGLFYGGVNAFASRPVSVNFTAMIDHLAAGSHTITVALTNTNSGAGTLSISTWTGSWMRVTEHQR